MTLLRATAAGACLLALASCGPDTGGPTVEKRDAAPARPALWRISDADTTLYLFGSIHMLTPGASWQSPAIDKALSDSRAAYFEADVESNPEELAAIVERLGRLPPTQHLSDRLTAEQKGSVMAAAARVGYPMQVLETQQPWFAAVSLADAAIRNAGYSTAEGVETILRRQAETAGKDIRFLESVERQLSALAELPEKVQVHYLTLSAADIEGAAPSLADMVNAWRVGDVSFLTRLLIDEDMARLPELQDALLARRNAEWADELAALLDAETGQFFVAVGVAHVLGGESLVEKLNRQGVRTERIQ